MTRFIEYNGTQIQLLDSEFDKAIIGIDLRNDRAIYDYVKMVDLVIASKSLDYNDAADFISYEYLSDWGQDKDYPIIAEIGADFMGGISE